MSDADKAELEQQPHSADETIAAPTNQQDVTITGVANVGMPADFNKQYYNDTDRSALSLSVLARARAAARRAPRPVKVV